MTTITKPSRRDATTLPLTVLPSEGDPSKKPATVLLVGNPNAGKTALFNAMTGLRAKTANFPGTTVDYRIGHARLGGQRARLIDLPGLYSLDALSPEERVTERALRGNAVSIGKPDLVLLVIDSTHLERNLFLAGEILEMNLPTVVALSMSDASRDLGIVTDTGKLAEALNCPVVPVSGRTSEGIDALKLAILERLGAGERINDDAGSAAPAAAPCCACSHSCPYAGRYDWAESIASACETQPTQAHGHKTEAIDRVLTHPVVGVAAFVAVMIAVFYMIFALADVPMGLIEGLFAGLGDLAGRFIAERMLHRLIVVGVIAGGGGVLVTLRQF